MFRVNCAILRSIELRLKQLIKFDDCMAMTVLRWQWEAQWKFKCFLTFMTEMATDYCDCYLLHYILEAVLLYYRIVILYQIPVVIFTFASMRKLSLVVYRTPETINCDCDIYYIRVFRVYRSLGIRDELLSLFCVLYLYIFMLQSGKPFLKYLDNVYICLSCNIISGVTNLFVFE